VAEPPHPDVPGAVESAIDRRVAHFATRLGAASADPEYLLTRTFLDRVEFFTSFPRRAIDMGREGLFLPPATCYRLFQSLPGTNFPEPTAVTLTGPCFRRESRYDRGRRLAFTMREIVFLGNESSVAEARDATSRASLRLARRLGLEARLEEAEDPFFTTAGRGKRILQRLLRLKLELVAPVAGDPLALASFNLHQDFFGTRLEITVEGRPAWTGCAAWGMERWRLAIESRWGPTTSEWPGEARHALGLP
jgi:seryl-tRNA synthetase